MIRAGALLILVATIAHPQAASRFADRSVLDKTGLVGQYDFALSYTEELPPGVSAGALINGGPIVAAGPAVFAAVRDQLGLRLRLEPQKGPVPILVGDDVEKPSEN